MKPLVLPDSTAYNDLVASCNARGLTLDEALEQARLAALWGRAVKSSALLHLLAVRGMLVSDDVRARVYARQELSVLDRWFERAVTAASIVEVFAEDLEAVDGDVSTDALEQSLSILRNTRLGEQLVAEGRTWGQLDTLEPQLALRLGRPTTSAERATLRRRLDVLGPERVGVVVLRFAPEALDAWLAAPDAT